MIQTEVGETPKQQPEKRFRAGPISAAVWRNEGTNAQGKPTVYRTVTMERRYKDKSDQWQSSHTLMRDDLPKASLVMGKAFEYLTLANST